MSRVAGRMAVAGVGLIGGSLALAARRAGLVDEVVGFGRSAANLALARERGVIDRIATDVAAAADADLVVLAAPVAACGALARAFAAHARPDAVVTDVASVKAPVVAALEAAWPSPAAVVGAHPIAGSERSGAAAADADLFRGRLCVLTPTPRTGGDALARVRTLWEGVGARVEEMPAAVHDDLLARASHLPHLVAYALVGAVAGRSFDGRAVLDYAGTGFRDTTRIAASPPEVWRDVLLANDDAVLRALAELQGAIDAVEARLRAGDGPGLERLLAAAAAARRGLGGSG